jgi:hypothetical protein
MKTSVTFSSKSDRGFSVIEVILALGIVSFCLVTLMALLPIAVATNQSALSQTEATSIASAVVADLRSPRNEGKTPRFEIPVPDASGEETPLENPLTLYFMNGGISTGELDSKPGSFSRYRVSLWFYPPENMKKGAVLVRVMITWPALLDADPDVLPTRFQGAVEFVTGLNASL